MSEDDAKKGSKTPPGGKKGGSGRRAAETGSAAKDVRARKSPSEKRKLHDMAMDEIFEASPWASGVVERKKAWPGPRYTRPTASVAVGSSVTKVLSQSSASGASKTIEELRIKVSLEESRPAGMPEFFNPWAESGSSDAAPSPVARTAIPEIRRERGPEYRLAPRPAPQLEGRAAFRPAPPRPPADVASGPANPWMAPPAGERKPEPAPEPPHAPAALAAEFINPWAGPAETVGEPKRDVEPEPSSEPVPPAPAFVNPWVGPSAPGGAARPDLRPAPPRPPVSAAPESAGPWTEAAKIPAGAAIPPAPPRPPVSAAPESAGPWTEATKIPAGAATPPVPPRPPAPESAGPWIEAAKIPADAATPPAPVLPTSPELPPPIQPAEAATPSMRPPEPGRVGGADQPAQPAAPEEKTAAPGEPAKRQAGYEDIPVENLFNGIFHVLGDGVDAAVDTGKCAFTELTRPIGQNVPAGEVPLECATSGIVRAVGDGLGGVVAKGKSAGSAVASRLRAGARGFSLAGFGLVCGVAGLITGRTIGKKIGL